MSKLYQNVYMLNIRPYYVTRTPFNCCACWNSAPLGRSGGSMSGSLSDLIIILILIILILILVTWYRRIKTLPIISNKNEKLWNSNNRSKPCDSQSLLGNRRFQIGCVFVQQYLLNTRNLVKIWHIYIFV